MSAPDTLIIPRIDLEAHIINVGLTPEGDMDTPNNNNEVGWYQGGSYPGNPGPAVLAAHTGTPESPSPFRNFEKIKKDDKIQVRDISGSVATFKVMETDITKPIDAPRERIFGATSDNRLTIITCTGVWIPSQNTYSHRLVIYAIRLS
jgi:sortase A